LSRVNLLLVDADEQGRHVLEISLRQAGFFVECALGNQPAWERLSIALPDLVIIDTSHPATDGFGLCQRVREAEAWQDLPLVIIGSDLSAETRLHALQLGADDYLTKPIFIKDVVARVRMVLDRRQRHHLAQGSHSGPFAGDLSEMPLVDVVQVMELGRKSGVVRLSTPPDQQGTLFFRDGKLVDAELGALEGAAAVYRMLAWTAGRFESELKAVRRKDMIGLANHAILAEGLRRADQWSKLLEQLPPLETVFDVDFKQLGERLGDIPDEVNAVLRLFDGERTLLQVVDACDYDDIEALTIIGRLYFDGLIHETVAAPPGAAPPEPRRWGTEGFERDGSMATAPGEPSSSAAAPADGGEAFARAVEAEAIAGSTDPPVAPALDAVEPNADAEGRSGRGGDSAVGAELRVAAGGLHAIATAPGTGAPFRVTAFTPLPAPPPLPSGPGVGERTPPLGSQLVATPPATPAAAPTTRPAATPAAAPTAAPTRGRRPTAERGSGAPTSPTLPRVTTTPGGGLRVPAPSATGPRGPRRITASGWSLGRDRAPTPALGSRASGEAVTSPSPQPPSPGAWDEATAPPRGTPRQRTRSGTIGVAEADEVTPALPLAAGSTATAEGLPSPRPGSGPAREAPAPRADAAPLTAAEPVLDTQDEVFFQADYQPDFRRTRSSTEFFVQRQQRLARWRWGALVVGSLALGAGLVVAWSHRPRRPVAPAAVLAVVAPPRPAAPRKVGVVAAPVVAQPLPVDAGSAVPGAVATIPTPNRAADAGAAGLPSPAPALARPTPATETPSAELKPATPGYGELLAQAQRLSRQQRQRALALWRQAVTLDPAGWEALEQLALDALNHGRYDEALTLARRAEAAQADAPVAQLVIGAVLQDRGNRRAARVAYEKYLRLCPRCEHTRDIAAVLRNL